MNKTSEILKNMDELTNHYVEEVNALGMEQLTQKATEEDWSLGQMYIHLINAALYMQLRHAEACLQGNTEIAAIGGEKTEAGVAVFSQGGFPPIRIQVPASPQYTPGQPQNKEQIVEGFRMVMSRMEEIARELEGHHSHYKVQHPRFGALDANEWFALVDMHFRHHLSQEKRLKQALAATAE